MAYFESFPTISYDPTGSKNFKTIKDILIRINIKESLKGTHALFEKYDINDGDTPEGVAYKKYGDSNLHWVVLLYNDINDPYYDWPLSHRDLDVYVRDKYSNADAIHHYEVAQTSGLTTKKLTVESSAAGATSVSNYVYEVALNDKKKQIKLIKREFVGQLVSELFEKVKD